MDNKKGIPVGETFNTVDMRLAPNELILTVIHPEMFLISQVDQPIVPPPAIGVDDGLQADTSSNDRLEGFTTTVGNDFGVDFAVPYSREISVDCVPVKADKCSYLKSVQIQGKESDNLTDFLPTIFIRLAYLLIFVIAELTAFIRFCSSHDPKSKNNRRF